MNTILSQTAYEGSIIHALCNNQIQSEQEERKDWSLLRKFRYGTEVGALSIPRLLVTALLAQKALFAQATSSSPPLPTSHTLSAKSLRVLTTLAFITPLKEEIVFRLFQQNIFKAIQTSTSFITPTFLKANRVFNWLTSPSARILATNTIFAAAHLFPTIITDLEGSLSQFFSIFLNPAESTIYENGGGFPGSLGFHMTVNAITTVATTIFGADLTHSIQEIHLPEHI